MHRMSRATISKTWAPLRWIAVAVSCGCFLHAPGALAQSGDEIVALLPPRTADAQLRIYERPVAKALARHFGEFASFKVAVVLPAGDVPAGAALVIDGRIVGGPEATITLEARVRDPGRGETVAAATTAPRALGEIDLAAKALAADLAPRIRVALVARRQRSVDEAALTKIDGGSVSGEPGRAGVPGTVSAAPPPAADTRPRMLVFRAGGSAGDAVAVDEVATVAMVQFAERLGFAPVPAAEIGLVDPTVVGDALNKHAARFAVMIEFLRVRFAWHGVLSARGAARIVVVGVDGKKLYDRVVETDTVVGSRGDRHLAMVRFLATQMADMAYAEVNRRLGTATGK